jgi:hypothetical protein
MIQSLRYANRISVSKTVKTDIMFRGSDMDSRTTLLMLQGDIKSGKDNQRILTPTSLLLFYVADPKTPDVYRLPTGSF